VRLVVVEFSGRGGMIHYVYQLCRGLSEAGADVTLVTDCNYELDGLPHPFRVNKLLRLWDARPQSESSPRRPLRKKLRRFARAFIYYREWIRLILYLRRQRPDLVQLGDLRFASDYPFVLLLRFLGLKLIDICHNVRPFALGGGGAGLFRLSRWEQLLFEKIYQSCDLVAVHFEANRREFLSRFDVEPDRVIAIPLGNEMIFEELRNPSANATRLREELSLSSENQVVLLFGTLSRYKGIEVLLEAFAIVRRADIRALLVIAGFALPDFDLSAISARVHELRLDAVVRIVPRYIEPGWVAAWMELANVAVFPYRFVYQSAALQVAQSLGVPVVVTNVGAMAEAVSDNETGLVVRSEDAAALAEAVLRILHQPELAHRLSRRAAENARTQFSWGLIARRLLDRYRLVLEDGRVRVRYQPKEGL